MARVTVYDVAEKAGVSTATVSFAFRHPDKVKDDTKAKVLRVAEELGYVPSGNARSLAKGRTGTLGMYAFDMLLERPQGSNLEDDWPDVSPRSIDEPLDGDEPNVLVYPLYVDEVLRGFELECWKSGKGILMGAASERDDHRSVTDIAGRVDGLALMPSGYNDTLPLSMLAKTIPLVMVGVGDEKLPAAYLQCDNASGMRQIVDHLVEVHHINDMAFVGGVNGGACARGTDADDVVSRYDAFKKCLEERGLDSSDALLDDSFATSFVGGCDLVTFKDSKNKQSAWKFIQWASKPEVQAEWYKKSSDLPASQKAWDDDALSGNDKLSAFGDQLKNTMAPPALSTWAQVSSAADRILEQMNKGQVTVDEGLKNLQSEADSIGTGN